MAITFQNQTVQRFPVTTGRFGVARWDITPPVGIYARNWGAAEIDFATGVHRPLTGSALSLAAPGGESPPLMLICLDLGWWCDRDVYNAIAGAVQRATTIPPDRIIIHLAHTHAGPVLDDKQPVAFKPEMTREYLGALTRSCVAGAIEALGNQTNGTLLWRYGHCSLATNRDFNTPPGSNHYLCGWNPHRVADNTLLVARLFDESGNTRATLVNYACHPTTLAFENSLISPDYPGAMREMVETETKAPCIFLLGACGELGPAEQYTGDTSVADRNGRELGWAVLSALSPINDAMAGLEFLGMVDSGAPLAIWKRIDCEVRATLKSVRLEVEVALRSDLPDLAEIERQLTANPQGAALERLNRLRRMRASFPSDAKSSVEQLTVWRLGDAVLCASPFEAYSDLQTTLRAARPQFPVAVLNVANGWGGYLPPRELYGKDLYESRQSPYAPGSLEAIEAAIISAINDLTSID